MVDGGDPSFEQSATGRQPNKLKKCLKFHTDFNVNLYKYIKKKFIEWF